MTTTEDLLTRGVEKIYPSKEELDKVLNKKLRIYQGFDPTSSQLHIGHMVGLRKLRQWQELGHEVIFLIGDFTATIGDPTGKDSARVPLTHEEVLKNADTYKKQASKILRFDGDNPVQIRFNSEWLSKISASELLKLAGNVTHGQLIERDMFQKRFKGNKDVYLSELLYPVMQAYDSVHMDVDVEVGGSDQTFNMLMGRKLMRNITKKEKFVMTLPLLTVDGEKKMGKSEGNAIGIADEPSDLYAEIMALGDDVIVKGFEYLTDVDMNEVRQIAEDLKGGKNPITYKKMLAFEIVKQLNSHDLAHKSQEDFEKTVQNKEMPEKISYYRTENEKMRLEDILVVSKLAESKSESKRKIEQGGVDIDGENITDPNRIVQFKEGMTIRAGRRFVKINWTP
ncbi:MAG TPA: tyrosine--tRNA ligase [Patescibacteria group bacterium]|nr:tyrosine--tRNA ligase [Patescibacteria group bacterium]